MRFAYIFNRFIYYLNFKDRYVISLFRNMMHDETNNMFK